MPAKGSASDKATPRRKRTSKKKSTAAYRKKHRPTKHEAPGGERMGAMRDVRELFEKTFSSQRDAIFILDAADPPAILDANPAAAEVFGYDREEILGRTTAFLHVDEAALREFQKHLYPAVAEHGFFHLPEFRMRRQDGTVFPTEHSVAPLKDEQDERIGWVSVVRDITDRKRAEDALRRSEEEFRSVIENAGLGISVVDRDGVHLAVNPAFCRMTGFEREELLGTGMPHEYWPEDLVPGLTEEVHLAAAEGHIQSETYFKRKDGNRFPVSITASSVLDETGQPVAFIGFVQDITERKQAEEEIESLSRFPSENPNPVIRISGEGEVLYRNEAASLVLAAWGCGEGERVTGHWHKLAQEALAGGRSLRPEVECGERVFSLTFAPVPEAGYVNVYGLDTTERKRAEEALRLAARRWQTTFDGVADAVCLLDADARIVQCNRAMGEMGGEQPAKCVGRNCCELVHGSPHHLEGCPLVSMRSSLRRETLELAVGQRWLQVTVDPLTDEAGDLTGAVHVVSDISERKRAEEELRGSEQQYRRIVETCLEGIWIIDSDSNTEFVNPRMAEMLGYTVEEMKGAPLFTFMDEEGKAKAARNVERRRQGIREVHEFRFCRKDGSDLYALASTNPLFDEDGQYAGALAMVADITERKRAEEALRRSEERYRDLVEGVDDLVTQVDGEGKFIFVNHAASKVFGLEPRQCTGLSAFDFVHPDDRDRTKEAFAGWVRDHLSSVTFENRMVSQSGQVRDLLWTVALHFDDAGEVAAINSIAHDITERKRAEEEQRRLEQRVQQAQKLESLGLLAGGIAHDFNNLLVSVLGNADLVLRDMPEVAPGRAGVEEIKKAAIRASELTGQMLAYSGRGQFVVKPVDLSEVVREMGHLLKASISKNASLRYELADDLPAVEADAAQIRQVAMNLITNASEAAGAEGGIITVRTGIIDVGRAYLAATDLGEGLPEGPYLFLEVSDTGRGMDAETRARLFDPFFSTKFTGRGLGLAAVLGIVRGHKGTIRVYSEPGQGTTFKVLLPFSDRPAEKADKPTAPVEAEWHGRGTVLVIDDEPAVRNVARMMLERAGLTVLTASDGQAGVELFGRHRDEIDAVLLDLTMPRMSGEETLQRLRRIRKDVPVILSSGFGEQDATSRFSGDRLAGFIQKPFELAVLVGQFRRVMEPRPAGREEA